MISFDFPWQSDGEPSTPETTVEGLISQRLRIVSSALATVGGALNNCVDDEKPNAEYRAPEADTVPASQLVQGDAKLVPENSSVIDYPGHFELEKMAIEAREELGRIFGEAA